MNLKNKKAINIYFIVIIAIFIFISFVHIWTALEIGKIAGLTFKQIISLHKIAEIDRIYKGYEVLIIQRLGGGVLYFLLGIFVVTQFCIGKIVEHRETKKILKNKNI
ncbi:MAG: hypothetical protein KAJ70_03170 [Candidatus Omnitrophica bacterium]|nr:hypothetical protein [Candidatus Omnitrophota bacterium]